MQLEKRSNLRLDFGILVHHNHKGICFKKIDERAKEVIRMFVRDYL